MAFHLEHDRLAIPNIDNTCILARAADDLRAFRWQGAQPFFRRFVGTVFVPHGRENTELGERGRAAHDPQDFLVFIWRQPVGGDQVFGDLGFLHDYPSGAPVFRRHGGQGKGGNLECSRLAGVRREKVHNPRGKKKGRERVSAQVQQGGKTRALPLSDY